MHSCADPELGDTMTAGELRTLAALIGEVGSANFRTAVSAQFGNLADDAEVALEVVALLFPPSAPFDVAADVLLELAAYCPQSIHLTPDPEPMVDAQTTLSRAGRA
jgi:hypothetical protein